MSASVGRAAHAQERDATSTTPSASFPRRSAARSTRSTPSAGWWTTAWTRRTARARPASCAGWPRSTARYAGRPETELGRELAETVARFPIPRAVLRGHRGRLPHGPRPTRRYATFADLRVYCERVASAVGLASIEIFGYHEPAHPRVRGRAGPRPPAHEHPARRGGRRRPGPALPAPRGPGALRGGGGGAPRGGARPGAPRPAEVDAAPGLRGRPRPRALRGRGRARCPRRTGASMLAAEIMGAIYRALLEELGAARLPDRGRAGPARRAAQGLDRAAHGRRGCYVGPMKVVVVGGGFAGLAAAIALQERRHEVVLLERRGVLGGRATSFRDAVTGEDVDNGTHLMIGAYTATLDLVRRAGRRATCCWSRTNLQHRVGGRARARPPSTARRSARRCTCWPACSACVCRCAVKLQALRLGLAVRFGRRPDGPDPRRVLPAHAARARRRGVCSGIRSPSPSSTSRRSARRRCSSTASTRRPSCATTGPRASCSCGAAGACCSSGWRATSRAAAACVRRGRAGRGHRARGRPRDAACATRSARRAREEIAAGRAPEPRRRAGRRGRVRRSRRTRCAPLLPEELARRGRPSPRSGASAARRSSRSRCGSTGWSWTGRCSACATARWSGSSTRAGSTAARARPSTSPSS